MDECYSISKIMDDVKKHPNNTPTSSNFFFRFCWAKFVLCVSSDFLSPKTCFILVVDMTKSLNELILEPDGDEIDCSIFKSWKYQGNVLAT